MANMIIAGQTLPIPDDQVDAFKAQLVTLKSGGHAVTVLGDPDGDHVWVYAPYGCPVVIYKKVE